MSDLRPEHEQDALVGRFDAYASASVPQFTAPPMIDVERAGRRQRRTRRVATLGVAVGVTAVLVAAGIAGKGLLRGTPHEVAPGARPSATGSPLPSFTPSDSALARTDLKNVVVDLPPWPTDGVSANRCPATGEVRFAGGTATDGGTATVGGLTHRISDRFSKTGLPRDQPLVGRLGDLADEVRVVRIFCQRADRQDAVVGVALLAVTARPDGGLHGLGYLTTETLDRLNSTVVGFVGGRLVVDLQRLVRSVPYAQRREFGWTTGGLAQVAGPTAVPDRLTVADVDPRNWVYDLTGLEPSTDEVACFPSDSVQVRDGVGDVPGSAIGPIVDGPTSTTCKAGTAKLLLDSPGTVPGAGPVRFVTVGVEIDGRVPIVAAYVMYDRSGSLVVQLLENRRVEAVGPPTVQRIAGDQLELSLSTLQGEQGFRFRWSGTPEGGQPARSFVKVS